MTRILLLLTAVVALAGTTRAQGASPSSVQSRIAEDVAGGWTYIQLDDNEDCAFGTPFGFFHRPSADASKLLIYFQGGGACWEWVSCSGMFDTSVDPSELRDFRGIFDASNPDNPFEGFAMVFIPYCTGDVHVGDAARTYSEGGPAVSHRGTHNVNQALQWAKAHHEEPTQVVVAGASAGSYGAIFHAPRIASLYPSADLVTIGDSGVPLLNDYEEILELWGAGSVLRPAWGLDDDVPLTLEQALSQAAATPRMRAVVHITSDQDAIQSAFYMISGSPTFRASTYALLDHLDQKPNGASFVVAGRDHGLMRTDQFYEYEADGVALSEWVGDLISGASVESIRCAECSVE
ncbi:MAG: pectin acetylesterase-family hydrolase [Bacteroidota bacterium]